jgi:pyridoxal phosphate enzyme (YggS family)
VLDPAALGARLDGVRDRMARAARRSGRDPSSIRLVAISKTFPADAVRAAAAAGQADFGENKVQEALPKMDATADLRLTWHLVGHLQSNKAKKAAARFDAVHSADDAEIVLALDRAAREAGRRLDVLVQVDLAGEATKHGARPEALPAILAAARACTAARIVGLMILPPAVADPEAARPYFAALRRLRDDLLKNGADPARLAQLSMGMSHDFEVAIEEGATLVRVGSAIFGDRPPA